MRNCNKSYTICTIHKNDVVSLLKVGEGMSDPDPDFVLEQTIWANDSVKKLLADMNIDG